MADDDHAGRPWWRRPGPPLLGFGGAVVAALVVVAVVTAGGGKHGDNVRLSTGAPTTRQFNVLVPHRYIQDPVPPTSLVTTPTTLPVPTSTTEPAPATSTTTAPPAASPTTSAPAPTVLTGRVVTASGAPVAGAYLIGLHDLRVTRAGADGTFSLPCPSEPLAVSSWLLPITTPGPHPNGIRTGTDTTSYPMEPVGVTSAYTFTGGTTLAAASTPACTGRPLTMALPQAATVDITFTGPGAGSGSPPPDNLYLPDLNPQAALETGAVNGGTQVVGGLAAGTLQIDGVTSTLSCSGPGVAPDPSAAGATVAVPAGGTVQVTCQT